MSDKPDEKAKGRFWTTLPGVLTGVTGMITAIAALIAAIAALGQAGLLPSQLGESPSSSPSSTPTSNESVGTSNTPESPPKSPTATLTPSPTPTSSPTITPSASPDTTFFTIVGSYPNREEAEVAADEIKRNNPDLDIRAFDRYRDDQYYPVIAASGTSKATALEVCRIVRARGIEDADAYVWTFSDHYIPCN